MRSEFDAIGNVQVENNNKTTLLRCPMPITILCNNDFVTPSHSVSLTLSLSQEVLSQKKGMDYGRIKQAKEGSALSVRA